MTSVATYFKYMGEKQPQILLQKIWILQEEVC